MLGTQAQRRAGGVHGHVAAAEHDDVLAMADGRVVLGELVRLHEVRAREVLVRAVHAGQVLAVDVQEARKARAHGQVEGVEAVLVEELVGIEEAASDRVVLKVDAQLLQTLDLALDDVLGRRNSGMP